MTLYDDLGIPREASQDDIKKAYKKLAMKHHPDRGGDKEVFQKISHAHDILSDEQKRSVYDQTGSETGEPAGFPGGAPFDMFMNMFGGQRGPQKRSTHEHVIGVSLADVYHKVKKNLKIEVVRNCFSCMRKCQRCNGQGGVTHQMGFMSFQQPCQECQSCGYLSSGCPQCHFSKITKEVKEVSFVVKHDTEVVVLQGLGEQAKKPEEIPGDLVIRIVIHPHPDFKQEGRDLVYTKKISFVDSVNGTIIVIPHFGGEFRVPTQDLGVIDPRKRYKIAGKGLSNGDLYIIFDIEYPPSNIRYVLGESGINS